MDEVYTIISHDYTYTVEKATTDEGKVVYRVYRGNRKLYEKKTLGSALATLIKSLGPATYKMI